MTGSACVVCESTNTLHPLPAFRDLPRVTSDCKPWPAGGELVVCSVCGTIQKPASAKWLAECRRIYDAYTIYHLSEGAEQVIFSPDGTANPRSRMLADHVIGRLSGGTGPKSTGRMIDIGCGNGAALASFGRVLSGWRLHGHELSDGALPRLSLIPGFENLHTGPLGAISGGFDLVTAIHSLEHIPSPGPALTDMRNLLAEDGALFIQVPDAETSPFDLLVADHRTHFSRATLNHLAVRHGVTVNSIDNRILPKEISLLGRRGAPTEAALPDPGEGMALAERTLSWLKAVLEAAEKAADGSASFGIFGSSVSGTWLYGALRDRTAFFVDEDVTRIGRDFDGKPILSPADVPAGAVVFVPLVTVTANRVIERLHDFPIRLVAPPAMA